MRFFAEFREFALRGNVMDLAVGVIIGGAFGKITTSLVEDIMMPVISFLMGGELDFHNLFWVLGAIPDGVPPTLSALKAAGVPVLAYGSFLTVLINFILLAFIVFMMVKTLNRIRSQMSQPKETVTNETDEAVLLLREIRDQLKAR